MTTTPRAEPTAPVEDLGGRSERATVAYLAYLGVVMAVGVDIALPAFDEIRTSFDMAPDAASVSLVGTAYFLGMAVGQLVVGPAADRFGRNRCLRVTLSVAALGALGSALAPGFGMLLAARFVWGLGSAGPAVLRTAIARDLFAGDRMARVVSRIMAVFLLGPIFIPAVGQVVLDASSWRGVFAVAILAGAVALAWTLRFGETLAVEHRRSFDLASFVDASRTVAATRPTVAYIGAQTATTAAFLVFLGSSQPVMDDVYGRADEFARWFGVAGAGMAVSLMASGRAIGRWGSRRVVVVVLAATVVCSVVGVVLFASSGGVPSFGVWFTWAAVTNATLIVVTPMCNALALEPMGALAGTASALLGFVTLAGGALAASVVDALVVDTVTPMALGYTVFSSLALVCLVLARRSEPAMTEVTDVPVD